MKFFPKSLALVLAATAEIPAAAQTQASYGTASVITNRVCGAGPSDPCSVGMGPPIFTKFIGGTNMALTSTALDMNGLGATGGNGAAFNIGYLPRLNAFASAGPTTRTGSTVLAFRSYTYTGDRAIDFALNGWLDFDTSGDSAPDDYPGDGALVVNLAILPMSALNGITTGMTAQQLLSFPIVGADCNSGAIASSYYDTASPPTAAGYHALTIGLSQTCSGGAIVLNPGDQFVLAATMQAISNRGGSIDASHTFKVEYDPINTVYADTGEAVGLERLYSSIVSPVPEPATWALMILGLGAIGGAMRGRKKGAASNRSRFLADAARAALG